MIDINKLKELDELDSPENTPVSVTVARQFFIEGPKRLQALKDACKTKDWKKINFAAHSFKGSCLGIGAVTLSQLLSDIEKLANSECGLRMINELTEDIEIQLGFDNLELERIIQPYLEVSKK